MQAGVCRVILLLAKLQAGRILHKVACPRELAKLTRCQTCLPAGSSLVPAVGPLA